MKYTVSVTHSHMSQENWLVCVSDFVAAWERQHRKTNQSVTQHHVPEELSFQTPVYFRFTLRL